jgi:hypothetical protein
LLWWLITRHDTVPVAATAPGAAGTVLGEVGRDTTTRSDPFSGGRFTLGYWVTDDDPWARKAGIHLFGAETRFFFLGQRSFSFSDGMSPTLVRPFFDVNDRVDSAVIVAAPGLATGTIADTVKADMWGSEANVWANLYYNCPGTCISFDAMAGFRFLQFNDDIRINRESTFAQNLAAFPAFTSLAGSTIQESEVFGTHNNFYGGQVGLAGKLFLGDFTAEADLKLALGTNSEEIHIDGRQLLTAPNGTTTTFPGALLALPSNIGRFHQNKFTQIPEADLKVSVPLGCHCTASLGFNIFYWSRIVRAADQIDQNIDITQIPNFPGAASATPTGLRQPGVPFDQTHLLVTGLEAGFAITW